MSYSRFPISAIVTCSLAALSPAFGGGYEALAHQFPLSDVQLLDSPFKQAMERNAEYLLSLEPDRLLHNTRKYAGLEPKGELYGGWESKGIAGHSLGHYLTAISQQYAATGDKRFRERIDYIISEMAGCQKKYGDGYIGALPPKELETMRDFGKGKVSAISPFNFKGGAWVPWYTQHKVLAGLKDAWVLGGNPQAKDVTLKLADWVDAITAPLTPAQQQEMLRVEHGGMLETLVEIHALTGERRYLDASKRFHHKEIFDPLLAGEDKLNGRHANTQIPKIIGEARNFEVTGDTDARRIAEFFWDRVVNQRSWVIGGNSNREHFFPIGKAAENLAPETAESCNTYNMLKLTEHLFDWNPKPQYADYYERALYNHILGSQEPEHGMFAYFMSFKPGHFKTYSTPHDSFWCCVGSGMENHTRYGSAIYFHDDDQLYVNLFVPSRLDWKNKGFVLEQRSEYPLKETVDFTIGKAPATPVAIQLRCPVWTAGPMVFEFNGNPVILKSKPGQYTEIKRIWKQGDKLRVRIPMKLWTEPLEGNPNKIAFLYGPLVLAGDLGPVAKTPSFPYAREQWDNFRAPTVEVPVLVRADGQDLTAKLKRVPGESLAFRTEGIGKPSDVTLRPFNRIFYQHYNIYWDVLSANEWQSRRTNIEADHKNRQAEEARIVDMLNPGEQQSEIDHATASEDSRIGDFKDRKYRDATGKGWFEFRMKVLPNTAQLLRCTYWGDDGGREFDILVNGHPLATQKLDRNQPGKFFHVDYPLPANVITGKKDVLIRFQPKPGSIAGGVFGCAVLKAK